MVHSPNLLSQAQHYHPTLEVAFLLSAESAQVNWWTLDRHHDSRPVQPKQLCIFPFKQDHAFTGNPPFEVLMFHFKRSCLAQIAQQLGFDAEIEISQQYAITDDLLWQLAITFHQHIQHPDLISSTYLHHLKTCFVMRLLLQYSTSPIPQPASALDIDSFVRSLNADWAEAQL